MFVVELSYKLFYGCGFAIDRFVRRCFWVYWRLEPSGNLCLDLLNTGYKNDNCFWNVNGLVKMYVMVVIS